MEEFRPLLMVQREFRLEDGIIKGEGIGKSYCPLDHPELPNALARIDGAEGALDFARGYGLLDYCALVDRKDRPGGDPLPWVLEHAASVRFALLLIDALARNDEDSMREVLLPRRVEVSDGGKPVFPDPGGDVQGTERGWYTLAMGPARVTQFVYSAGTPGHPPLRSHALHIVRDLVNGNTKNVCRVLGIDGGKLSLGYTAPALVEFIWHHVAEWALTAQEGGAKGIKLCEECGTPFLVTDRRQRFCPKAKGWQGGSPCASRHRMRRFRQRKTEEGN